jgi:hypothetical protein
LGGSAFGGAPRDPLEEKKYWLIKGFLSAVGFSAVIFFCL